MDAARIAAMTQTLVHRGPDDAGLYVRGPIGLGFRRLSIIDLSPAGHQPMGDEDARVWIVFNGEIYNFPELRRELESLGAVFRSRSDTEVILRGYIRWGDAVLNRLNGMFGLAIWDERQRRLLFARDPMGIKPVYYAERNGTLFFGSEVRAVTAGLGTPPDLDPLSANLFLRYRYTPAPRTIFAGIRKLAAGEKIVATDGAITVSRWYGFIPRPFSPAPNPRDAAEHLLEIYRRSIRRQLVSDVRVGLLLSGGIDSALLLGLTSLDRRDWPTFTVGYGPSFADDELDDAAASARIFGARHTSVRLDQDQFERALPDIVGCLEEPVASSSIVPMYFVAQRARQDVKVALIGQGPDELFGGYKRHLGVRYGAAFRALPPLIQLALSRAVRALPRNEGLKRAVGSLSVSDQLERYRNVFALDSASLVDGLFRPGVLPSDPDAAVRQSWAELEPVLEPLDELNGFQLVELRSSLPDELLMYGDKLSMAHSLEVRVPYLDREVVEFAQCLNASFKVRHGARKWLHRQVCRRFLPPEILRRKKRGFAVNVVDDWFRESLSGRIADYLRDPGSHVYRYVRHEAVSGLLRAHGSGRNDHHKLLFSLVVLEQWLRCHAPSSRSVPAADPREFAVK